VEALIPKETSGEERPGRNASKQILGSLHDRLGRRASLRRFLPEAFILLIVCGRAGAVNNVITVEETNTTDQVRKHSLGECRILVIKVKGRLGSKDFFVPLSERERCILEFLGNSLRYTFIRIPTGFGVYQGGKLTSDGFGSRTRGKENVKL
jgi:hypothetical protein